MSSTQDNKKPQAKTVISEMSHRDSAKPYDPSSYRIINKETITIYSPNIISKKKRIISV